MEREGITIFTNRENILKHNIETLSQPTEEVTHYDCIFSKIHMVRAGTNFVRFGAQIEFEIYQAAKEVLWRHCFRYGLRPVQELDEQVVTAAVQRGQWSQVEEIVTPFHCNRFYDNGNHFSDHEW